jgi:hypothetical protein
LLVHYDPQYQYSLAWYEERRQKHPEEALSPRPSRLEGVPRKSLKCIQALIIPPIFFYI